MQTNLDGIFNIINELKPKNSSGHDGISSKPVKYLKNEIAPPLSIVINKSIESGHVSATMKLTKVAILLVYSLTYPRLLIL